MATSHKYVPTEKKRWTYGAELELVDWPQREQLASGMMIDEAERANVNSNGIAVDGTGKLYHLGGEILTVPSVEPSGPADQLLWVKTKFAEATVNFRTGLNIHVRVPGLRNNLKKLKQLQAFVHKMMPALIPIIDNIPMPTVRDFPDSRVLTGAKRDYNRCKKNHHALLPKWRLELQLKARTPQEFFEAEAVHLATGKVHWALALRNCVNLRQLMQTDTVEFRHFPGSASPAEVLNATLWCQSFLEAAFNGGLTTVEDLLRRFGPGEGRAWPKFSQYDPWLDAGYFFTSKHYNSVEIVPEHIKLWLAKPKKKVQERHVLSNES